LGDGGEAIASGMPGEFAERPAGGVAGRFAGRCADGLAGEALAGMAAGIDIRSDTGIGLGIGLGIDTGIDSGIDTGIGLGIDTGPQALAGEPGRGRFRYLDTLTIGFVVVLLISNLVGPKICQFGPFKVSGAQLLFPITYICGDIFTEVYGYGASRRAVWLGFFAMALLAGMGALVVALPASPEWHEQQAFATVFGLVPRFAAASLMAYWAGEFTNSYTLAKLKILTGGRWLWTRTVGSTVTGQLVDTVVIMTVAFWGYPLRTVLTLIGSAYLAKVVYEVAATPVTYAVVAALKRAERVDTFDRHTNFNPFYRGE
jgi:uncharacterized integral membrane protein (TIGR00697 family)